MNNGYQNFNRCQYCGAMLGAGDAFCPNCGQKTTSSEGHQEFSVNTDILQNNNALDLKNKKSSKLVTWLVVGIIAVLVLAVVVFFVGRIYVSDLIYQNACYNLDTGDYYSAYIDFDNIGGYKDSDQKVDECVYEWIDYILNEGEVHDATTFLQTVALTSEQDSVVYEKLMDEIGAHNSLEYWDQTQEVKVVYTLLRALPPSYEDVELLVRFFNALAYGDIHPLDDYVIDNKTLLESLWHLGVVKDLVVNDAAVCGFLIGNWKSSDNLYYFNFYTEDSGVIGCSYNLPWVDKPAGMKYYDIENLIFYWDDASDKHLAKVYRFTIIDYNTISVYCYKDSRTYKLYR